MGLKLIDEHLLFHALIILVIGLLCGAPMGRAIVAGAHAQKVNAWRVAHSGLSMGGVMMMSLALVIASLEISGWVYTVVLASTLVSGYGFALALPVGAATDNRGLSHSGGALNRMVHLGNLLGAYGSLVSALVLVAVTGFRLWS